MDDRPLSTLDLWRDLRARIWDALIWWLMTRVLTPLLQLGVRAAELPPHVNARSRIYPEFDVRAHNAAEPVKFGDAVYVDDDGRARPITLYREPDLRDTGITDRIKHSAWAHYRDEDGDLHSVRPDRTPLVDASMQDLAAEFLRARSDAESTPDPLDRAIVAALRDAYSRELYRRREQGRSPLVAVRGTIYRITPLAPGAVDLSVDE